MSEWKNVIIVEDDPIAALLTKKVLERDSAFGAYHHYPNGKAAVEGLNKFVKTFKSHIYGLTFF